jgi:hypothetical protein
MSLLVVAWATCIPRRRRTKAGALRQSVFECTGGVIVVGFATQVVCPVKFRNALLAVAHANAMCWAVELCVAVDNEHFSFLNRLQMK